MDALILQMFNVLYLANTLYHSYDIKIVWSDRIRLNPRLETLNFSSTFQLNDLHFYVAFEVAMKTGVSLFVNRFEAIW